VRQESLARMSPPRKRQRHLSSRISYNQCISATMDSNQHTQYPEDGSAYLPGQPQTQPLETPQRAALSQPDPAQSASANPYTSSPPDNGLSYENSHDSHPGNKYEPMRGNDPLVRGQQHSKKLSKKWQQRLYWLASPGYPRSR